jgi:fluoroacetyl-CoA thioesterase
MELAPGLRASITREVTESMTAVSLGSGDVPVLGTPAVLALMEEAACAAVAGALGDGATSVGTRVELDHVAPSKVGTTVEAVATLTGVDGRTISFECEAREGERVVARASHRRVIVDRERFLA